MMTYEVYGFLCFMQVFGIKPDITIMNIHTASTRLIDT